MYLFTAPVLFVSESFTHLTIELLYEPVLKPKDAALNKTGKSQRQKSVQYMSGGKENKVRAWLGKPLPVVQPPFGTYFAQS